MDDIRIVPSDPDWSRQYEAEKRRLLDALASFPVTDIAHIGSTAVSGLPAKPVIDILIATPLLERARAVLPGRLEPLGYAFWAENPDTDRLFFVRGLPPRGPRTHHVHVCAADGDVWTRHLAFRDRLRANPTEAAAYAALKLQLAETHRNDREAYTDAKDAFIADILRRG